MNGQLTHDEIIEVVCVACPDGTTLWLVKDEDDMEKAFERWNAALDPTQRQIYHLLGCTAGAVVIRMLRSVYDKIPTRVQPEGAPL